MTFGKINDKVKPFSQGFCFFYYRILIALVKNAYNETLHIEISETLYFV